MEVLKGEKEALIAKSVRQHEEGRIAQEELRALQQARDDKEAIEGELNAVKEERDFLRIQVEGIEAQCQEIRIEKAALEAKLEEAEEKLDQSVGETRDSGGKLMLIIQEMEDDMKLLKDDHKQRLDQMKRNMEQLEEDIELVNAENSSLKEKLMEHEDEQLASLGTEHELKQVKSEVEKLKNTHETDKQRMAKLMSIIQEKEDQVKAALKENEKLKDLSRELEETQYELNQLNTEKQILRSKLDEALKTVSSDNQQNDERVGEVSLLHQPCVYLERCCISYASVFLVFTANANYRRDES